MGLMGLREKINLLVYLSPLFNVAYSCIADFLWKTPHNDWITPQPLDQPHNTMMRSATLPSLMLKEAESIVYLGSVTIDCNKK